MSALNLDGLTDAQLRLFAVRCARRVQHLMADPRSVAAWAAAAAAWYAELAAARASEAAAEAAERAEQQKILDEVRNMK